MKLRVAGASFRRIGEVLGVSAMQAHRDVMHALNETLADRAAAVETYRALENARLDALTLAVWPRAQKGDVEAVRAAVRIAERRARLNGLDAAVAQKLELSGPSGAPVAVEAAPTEARLSDQELYRRLHLAVSATACLAGVPDPTMLGAPAPEPAPPTPAELYRQELERRRASGQ